MYPSTDFPLNLFDTRKYRPNMEAVTILQKESIFMKKVASRKIIRRDITRHSLANALEKFLSPLERRAKLVNLNSLMMQDEKIDLINAVIFTYPRVNLAHVERLLLDFSNDMNTRMREPDKHAGAILGNNCLTLIHCTMGLHTMTTRGRMVTRMIDADTITRFVRFKAAGDVDGSINVYYWERGGHSEFLVEWLGLSLDARKEYLNNTHSIKVKRDDGVSLVLKYDDEMLAATLAQGSYLRWVMN